MQRTPDMLREQRFKGKLGGFDKEEVLQFLLDVADDLEELIEENSLLKSQVETAREKQKSLEDLFLSAKQFTDEKIKTAELEAKEILSQAQLKVSELDNAAQQTMAEAQQKASEIQAEASEKADEILQDAQKNKDALETELAALREKKN
ncbi:MAG: DivIVA domain-containing protein, partial [Desulfomonilia bacterium]|nr:DivIVA domain-containing protein [Desulfomonilia bacterium]